jgi:membrane-bound lytic murein transglycosylase MltF|tara:strand:+ start:913 stop:1104 length:192 start_codon:yes stop_codon:yes gene_type:complete
LSDKDYTKKQRQREWYIRNKPKKNLEGKVKRLFQRIENDISLERLLDKLFYIQEDETDLSDEE